MTALGLYKDESRLRADNFEQNRQRRFRSGNLTPFSANLAFVLHKCKADSVNESYKVTVLVNEMPVSLLTNAGELACATDSENYSTCDYAALKKQLEKFLTPNYTEVCHKHEEL